MLSLLQSGSRDGSYPVYTGFWIDWSRGKVIGSTLTLMRDDANLFIAFVAFFLTVVTAKLWSIACFAFHSFFSTQDPRDMLHHQRQALLRNNGAPAGMALTLLLRLAWVWRQNGGGIRRVVPLSACTVLLAIGFAAAAGFSSRIALGDTVLLRGESGFIDSHLDLGVNAPPDQRFQFRTIIHCAPLTTKGYRSSHTRSDNQTFSRYHYGYNAFYNYTHEYPVPDNALNSLEYNNDTASGFNLNTQYTLFQAFATPYNGSFPFPSQYSTFFPIPELSNYQANINIVFLSPNQVTFPQPTTDPWYNSSQSGSIWLKETPLNFMPSIESVSGVLGPTSLTSRFTLEVGRQGFLPPDQWQLDVQNWNSIILTLFQQSMISVVLGDIPAYPESDLEKYVIRPESEEAKTICSNQKINSAYHISFSVFGIAVIAVIGPFVIIVFFTIEPITHYIQRRLKRSAYRRLEWISMGTLQLQRQLYEAHGIEEWKNCDEMIPILERPGVLLPTLDISDETHPSTKRRSQLLKGPNQVSTERSSDTEVPSARGDHTQPRQQMSDIERHNREVQQDDVPTHMEVLSVDERIRSLEIPAATTGLRDCMRPVSIQEALERRTSTCL
ncbi:hypothetical protein NPX13_g3710 [Xylaria arbuscula]|uniref:Uncharacterized protein n=1 Tax=Xylaria arbuscula TaxID=114810 RepID=A0A9W8NHY6_9PEZI|nr:hypothetical protein NPX13_g3710 [Xylaria arbuscula]